MLEKREIKDCPPELGEFNYKNKEEELIRRPYFKASLILL
jgi:hypothetical protein